MEFTKYFIAAIQSFLFVGSELFGGPDSLAGAPEEETVSIAKIIIYRVRQ